VRYSTSKNCVTLKTGYMGRSRSLKMAPFDRPYTTFYRSAIVTIALSCTIFEFFWRWIVTLKWVKICAVSYSPFIVTMALSCMLTIIGRKSLNFIPHLYLAPPQGWRSTWNFAKLFDIHKARAIVLPWCEENMLTRSTEYRNVTDRRTDRQTDKQTDRHNCYIDIAHQCADAR